MEKWFDPVAIVNGTPDVFNPSKGISEIGDALAARSDRRLRREQATAQMDLERQKADTYRQQVAATKSAQERADRALAVKTAQADARQRGTDVQAIGKAFGAGAPGLAQLIAASSQYENPTTHELQGIQLAKKPNELPNPTTPSEPVAPTFVGPLEAPDEAQARAMAKGLGWNKPAETPGGPTEPGPMVPGAPGPHEGPTEQEAAAALAEGERARAEVEAEQAKRDQYGQQRTAYPAQVAATAQAQADYAEREKNPRYSAHFPGGQSVDINPREQADFKAAEDRDTAAKLRQQAAAVAVQDPNTARQMLTTANMLDAGVSMGRSAPVTSMVSQTVGNEFKAGEGDKNRASNEGIQNRHDAARIKAKHIGNGLGAPGVALPTAADARVIKEINDSMGEMNRKGGTEEQLQHMHGTLAQLKASPDNPVLWTNALDAAIRTNTGRAAIKAQYDLYRQHAGGSVAKFDDWLQGIADGNMGGTSKANFMGAFDAGENELRAQTKAAYDKLRGYDSDTTVQGRPAIKRAYQATVRNTFGSDPGFAGNQQQAPAAAPAQGATTTLKMPDGSMATFDATGKRIK